MATDLWLVEAVVYDPSTGGVITLRYASGQGHVTGGSETPASTWYDGRIKQPALLKRDLFDTGTTTGRSRMAIGSLVLTNNDGALDTLLTYGFSGRSLTVRRGTVGAAYPSGFPVQYSLTMEQPEASGDDLVIRLRDNMLDLQQPIQPNKYAGSNVLPAGVEGVIGDLYGKPKPLCLGAVQNIPAICVNTSKLIYQVSDGAVTSVDAVYDSGVGLSSGRFWNTRSHSFGVAAIAALAYGSGLFVAGGAAGALETSPDGVTWTVRASGFGADDVLGAAYGAGIYVIVGSSGKLASSPTGAVWTARVSQFGADTILAVTYDTTLSLFIAVGGSGKISTSPDGINWTARTSSVATLLQGVASLNGFVVAVGNLGAIVTSRDGTTWTQRSTAFLATDLHGVTYGNGMWVASGSGSTNNSTTWARSPDGITWTAFVAPFSTAGVDSYIVFGTQFLAVGSAGTLYTSTDGVTWVQTTTSPFGSTNMRAVIYGNGQYMAVGPGTVMQTTSVAYGNMTALLDDAQAPAAGEFKACVSAGYFRLGARPTGLITADVTQGAAAANRTAGQLFAAVLARAGKTAGTSAGQWLAADVTALDIANSAVCGDWIDREDTFAAVLDRIAGSVGAWWGVDAAGRYRIVRFTAPSGTPVLTFTAMDLKQSLQRLATNDVSKGLPSWRTTVRYGRNFAVQDRDLAASVTDARRGFLAKEWREAIADDAAVKAAHLLAAPTVEDTLLYSSSDAAVEASRRQVMRGVLRNRFLTVVELNDDTNGLDLGDVVALQHTRYGLSAGVNYRIIGVDPDVRAKALALTLWGPSDPVSLFRLPALTLSGTGTVT